MMLRSRILIAVFILLPALGFSQSLSKAFDYLTVGNYEEARTAIDEVLKWDHQNPAAHYLMAQYFFSKENAKWNLDSAYLEVMQGVAGLNKEWKEKDLEKLQATGWRSYTVNELKNNICNTAYYLADSVNTVQAWDHFIKTYTASSKLKLAIDKRNKLAFNQVLVDDGGMSWNDFVQKYPYAASVPGAQAVYEKHLFETQTTAGTWQAYKTFADKFPDCAYHRQAVDQYETLHYASCTADHTPAAFLQFAKDFPESPYAAAARDSFYVASTRDHSVKSYVDFIAANPGSKWVKDAWQHIYEIETPDYSAKELREFKAHYPKYPDMASIDRNIRLSSRQLEKISRHGLYGFIDRQTRDTIIKPQFIEASPFNEGMAVVKLACKSNSCATYAYVTPDGTIIQPEAYSHANTFINGRALVSIGRCGIDSCKYGFINRFGKWIVPPVYDVAFEYADGLAMVYDKHLGYGFIDEAGKVVVPLQYSAAGNFNEGLAYVKTEGNGLYGFIDKQGKMVIAPSFRTAGSFREGLAPATDQQNQWGYIDTNGSWAIQPQFDFAMPFIGGQAHVMLKVADPKDPSLPGIVDGRLIDKKGRIL